MSHQNVIVLSTIFWQFYLFWTIKILFEFFTALWTALMQLCKQSNLGPFLTSTLENTSLWMRGTFFTRRLKLRFFKTNQKKIKTFLIKWRQIGGLNLVINDYLQHKFGLYFQRMIKWSSDNMIKIQKVIKSELVVKYTKWTEIAKIKIWSGFGQRLSFRFFGLQSSDPISIKAWT